MTGRSDDDDNYELDFTSRELPHVRLRIVRRDCGPIRVRNQVLQGIKRVEQVEFIITGLGQRSPGRTHRETTV